MSMDNLIKKAVNHIKNSEIDQFFSVAQEISDTNIEHPLGLQLIGLYLFELGQTDEAKFCFEKAIQLKPDSSHYPHVHLAQLTEKDESIYHYNKAIELMKRYNDSVKEDYLFVPTKNDISNCYIHIAQKYMDQEINGSNINPKPLCKLNAETAIMEDPTNPAAHLMMADYYYFYLESKDLCKSNIEKCLSLQKSKINSDNQDEAMTSLDVDDRIKCAEILLDLEMYKEIHDVLDSILVEDEEIIQVHYLYATSIDKLLMSNPEMEDRGQTASKLVDHALAVKELADIEFENNLIVEMEELIKKYKAIVEDIEDDSDIEDDDIVDDQHMDVDKYIYEA